MECLFGGGDTDCAKKHAKSLRDLMRPAAGMWLTPEEPSPSAASTACPADLISSLCLWTPLNVEQMHGRKDLHQPSLDTECCWYLQTCTRIAKSSKQSGA
ncbi:hypothetical protein ACQJBY_032977 [Aegilops geniculata]